MQTNLEQNPRAQLMLMKLQATMDKMDTMIEADDPVTLSQEVDEELEILKDIPDYTDAEINVLLKELFEKDRE